MKHILSIALTACTLQHAHAQSVTELPFANYVPTPQNEEDIPLGYEAVTGVRSTYIHRGEKLANQLLDFQFNGFFSYADNKHLEYGVYFGTAFGDESFNESNIHFNYLEEFGAWTYAAGANFRYIDDAEDFFTVELNVSTTYHINADNEFVGLISYDTDQEGFYGSFTYKGYKDLNTKSFLSYNLGVSAAYDYYETDGFRDVFGRISYTYNLTEEVSISPFSGFSITDDDEELYTGLWFEISF